MLKNYASFSMTIVSTSDTKSDRGFQKVLFKGISPIKKWAYVEGLTTWINLGNMYSLISPPPQDLYCSKCMKITQ